RSTFDTTHDLWVEQIMHVGLAKWGFTGRSEPAFGGLHAHKNPPIRTVPAKSVEHELEHFFANASIVALLAVSPTESLRSRNIRVQSKTFAHQRPLLGLKAKGSDREIRNVGGRETRSDGVDQRLIIGSPLVMPNHRIDVEGNAKAACPTF